MTQINMKKNLWCHLSHNGHHIAMHFSMWSGKEVVYVNDHPVSEKRNLLKFTGRHTIELDNAPHVVELEVLNPFTYHVELRLKKGARTLASKNTHLLKANKRAARQLAGFFITCCIVGGLAGLLTARLFTG
ncbi:MAG: hypothetical protein WA981_05765 [Glaciecola sp.]